VRGDDNEGIIGRAGGGVVTEQEGAEEEEGQEGGEREDRLHGFGRGMTSVGSTVA
jgi:hypothetical protein